MKKELRIAELNKASAKKGLLLSELSERLKTIPLNELVKYVEHNRPKVISIPTKGELKIAIVKLNNLDIGILTELLPENHRLYRLRIELSEDLDSSTYPLLCVCDGCPYAPFRIMGVEVTHDRNSQEFAIELYSENSSNAFRRLRRRRPVPQNLSGFAAFFDNFKFFYELIITHYSKFFKKNELEKFTALAANSLALLQKEKAPLDFSS